MNNDKMIKFVKQWREIETKQKDLDYEKTIFARDLRGEFEGGDRGDESFINWCAIELGMLSREAGELLMRSMVAKVVPDARTYKRVGGFRAIRSLQGVSRAQQVAVLEAVKVTGKKVAEVMRERGLVGVNSRPERQDYKHDIETLAKYIAQHCVGTGKKIPKDVLTIVDMYAPKQRLQSVA